MPNAIAENATETVGMTGYQNGAHEALAVPRSAAEQLGATLAATTRSPVFRRGCW